MLHPDQMVQSNEVMPLFPSFVWKTQLKEQVFTDINARIQGALDRLTSTQPVLPHGGQYQTDQTLHRLPELTDFNEIVLSAAYGALDFLSSEHNPLLITGCWANINAPGATHAAHTHPNNYLSGVYYLQADEGARQISFYDPRPQLGLINPVVRETTAENAAQAHLEIAEGMLVLFPSWLQHSVAENRSPRNRISIAVNLMFSQFGENMAAPKWQGNIPVS